MEKKKLINEIIDLCDKVEALERENAELKKAKVKDDNFEDLEIAGRKKLFKCVKSYSLDYSSYSVEKDGKLLTLFEWLDTLDMGIFLTSYCKALNNHSLKELVGYFEDELEAVYNAKLDKIERIEKASKEKEEGEK